MVSDPYNLERFRAAQDLCFHRVRAELESGRKQSHWIWFVFPQISGLGQSSMDATYAIKSIDEAKAYLNDGLLAGRLDECLELLSKLQTNDIKQVMGHPDDLKLRSCLTLFSRVAKLPKPFTQLLIKYFNGEPDPMTEKILNSL